MRLFFVIGLLVLTYKLCFAQFEIYGKVIDSTGYELIGANVMELGTSNGCIADEFGDFLLDVSESAMIQISFIGYLDTIVDASKVQGDTIVLKMDMQIEDIVLSHWHYSRTFTIGYFGDFSRMPYGIASHYFRPYLFRKTALLSGHLYYKTNFKSDYDFKFFLSRLNVIDKEHYSLQIWGQYHDRKVEINSLKNEVTDYQLTFANSIGNIIGFSPGVIYRSEKFDLENHLWGAYVGFNRGFSKINQIWNFNYSHFIDYSEFSISIYQKFFKNYRILSNFQIGLNYNKFHRYDELNFLLRYSFNH